MSLNSSGVCNRPIVVIGSVSCVPGGDGSAPSRPAGFVVFCSRTAAETSLTTWDDADAGAMCYEVRPVDPCGNERSY